MTEGDLTGTCADCGTAAQVTVLPVRWLTDDELVAMLPVRVCAYCRELREISKPR